MGQEGIKNAHLQCFQIGHILKRAWHDARDLVMSQRPGITEKKKECKVNIIKLSGEHPRPI